jgi:rhodanese-related sulfurtransferase
MSVSAGSGEISASDLLLELRQRSGEVAVLDVREEGRFARGHILLAASLPLSRLELHITRLVPRLPCRVVLCDDDDGTARTAAVRLRRLGYSDAVVLRGGMSAWAAADGEIFTGLNAPSKALGAYAQSELGIPDIEPKQLASAMKAGNGPDVIDCRPFAEYQRGCIPGAVNCPGVELLKRFPEIDATDTLVVNCAGRTRGLLAAQTLVDFGFATKAVALRDGTMGWELAGHTLEAGATRMLSGTTTTRHHVSRNAAAAIRRKFGIQLLDAETLARWQMDRTRTTYLFDIRQAEEYWAGHIPGARHVAGGQLVQNLDQHVATLGARIVIADDDGVRATAVALWLRRMGWRDVTIILNSDEGERVEIGTEQPITILPPDADRVSAQELRALLDRSDVVVIDLATSRDYRNGHIPGAWFVVRSRLAKMFGSLPKAGTVVLTSEDGVLAAFASKDEVAFGSAVRVLQGGTASWREAGYALSKSLDRFIDEADDVVLKPSELNEGRDEAMREYLSGNDGLLDKVQRDGTLHLAALRVQL